MSRMLSRPCCCFNLAVGGFGVFSFLVFALLVVVVVLPCFSFIWRFGVGASNETLDGFNLILLFELVLLVILVGSGASGACKLDAGVVVVGGGACSVGCAGRCSSSSVAVAVWVDGGGGGVVEETRSSTTSPTNRDDDSLAAISSFTVLLLELSSILPWCLCNELRCVAFRCVE